jgi:predicted RNase H-like nuclease (RuvC/YqgF family)
MLVDAETLGSFAGYIGSLFVFGFTIVRVLDKKAEDRQNRMEHRHQEEMNAIRQDIADKHSHNGNEMKNLHSRVNDVKEKYVRQEVHDRDIALMRSSLTEFRSEIKQDLTTGIAAFNGGLSAMRKDFTEHLMKLSERNNSN